MKRARPQRAPLALGVLLLAIVTLRLLTGCTPAAWATLLGLAPVAAQVATAGLGAASSIAQAVEASRGAPLTRDELVQLEARVLALEHALREQRALEAARADAGSRELAAALDREAVARGAVAVADLEIAALVARLHAVALADAGAEQ